jgi:hypothetical protein
MPLAGCCGVKMCLVIAAGFDPGRASLGDVFVQMYNEVILLLKYHYLVCIGVHSRLLIRALDVKIGGVLTDLLCFEGGHCLKPWIK